MFDIMISNGGEHGPIFLFATIDPDLSFSLSVRQSRESGEALPVVVKVFVARGGGSDHPFPRG